MIDTKGLLRLIENANIHDKKYMERLNGQVHAYVWKLDNDFHVRTSDTGSLEFKLSCGKDSLYEVIPNYAKSRDVIERIRPKGWFLTSSTKNKFGWYTVELVKDYKKIVSKAFISDKLAELYGSVMAIGISRGDL